MSIYEQILIDNTKSYKLFDLVEDLYDKNVEHEAGLKIMNIFLKREAPELEVKKAMFTEDTTVSYKGERLFTIYNMDNTFNLEY